MNNAISPNGNGGTSRKPAGKLELMLFARNFLKHPNMVGWMLPSSPSVVNTVLAQVDWSGVKVIVEYGPGIGTFTRPILDRMRPDAILIALETNQDFFSLLRDRICDPRFRLFNESATEVESALARLELTHADCVVSGIPFKTLREDLREVIVSETHRVLRPDGQFLVYQLSDVVLPYLERAFGSVSQNLERRSLLPARMFYCAR